MNEVLKHNMVVKDFENNKSIESSFECKTEDFIDFTTEFYKKIHDLMYRGKILYPNFKILVGRKEMEYVCIARKILPTDDEHIAIAKNLVQTSYKNIIFVPVESMLEVVPKDSIEAYFMEKYNLK